MCVQRRSFSGPYFPAFGGVRIRTLFMQCAALRVFLKLSTIMTIIVDEAWDNKSDMCAYFFKESRFSENNKILKKDTKRNMQICIK